MNQLVYFVKTIKTKDATMQSKSSDFSFGVSFFNSVLFGPNGKSNQAPVKVQPERVLQRRNDFRNQKLTANISNNSDLAIEGDGLGRRNKIQS
jgi:hypothetical protein